MSKWFGITIVVLFVFWLTLLSLAQLKLNAATHKHAKIIMQHEDDLFVIKLRMGQPMVQAKPKLRYTPTAPPLPRQRRGPIAVPSKSESPDVELTPIRSCW